MTDSSRNERGRGAADLQDSPDLLEALEMSLKQDGTAQLMRERIVALQEQLRGAIDNHSWSIYLGLEHAVNERMSYVMMKLSFELLSHAVLPHLHRQRQPPASSAQCRRSPESR
jgi:hypothetical protein